MRCKHSDSDRYFVTELGMQYLAASAGTRPGPVARHGGMAVVDPKRPDRSQRKVHRREHMASVNRCFARLADDAVRAGWRFEEWRDEPASFYRFVDDDERIVQIRPDGAGILRRGAEEHPFLLEYDRGTLGARDYRAKFHGYRRYYDESHWLDLWKDGEPVLLFVCSDDRTAARVRRAAERHGRGIPLLITTESWSARGRGNHEGLLGNVWRSRAPGGWRIRWPKLPARGDASGRAA